MKDAFTDQELKLAFRRLMENMPVDVGAAQDRFAQALPPEQREKMLVAVSKKKANDAVTAKITANLRSEREAEEKRRLALKRQESEESPDAKQPENESDQSATPPQKLR